MPDETTGAGDFAPDEWLGTKAAAQKLGINNRTLYRLMDEGQLPAYRIGRVLRIKQADIAVFLDEHRVQPGSLAHLYPGEAAEAADD